MTKEQVIQFKDKTFKAVPDFSGTCKSCDLGLVECAAFHDANEAALPEGCMNISWVEVAPEVQSNTSPIEVTKEVCAYSLTADQLATLVAICNNKAYCSPESMAAVAKLVSDPEFTEFQRLHSKFGHLFN